jgi:hypothetical protein
MGALSLCERILIYVFYTTLGALLLHITDLFVALEGATVEANASVPPTLRLVDVLFNVTLVVATELLLPPPLLPLLLSVTVTVQATILPPSTVLTIMIVLPADMPVTKPLSDTVALAGEVLLHVTALFVALEGATETNRFSVSPTATESAVLFKETPVTGTSTAPLLTGVTETAQVDLLPPSTEIAEMAVLPAHMPMTTPSVTVAISGWSLLHVMSLFAALSGKTVAVRVS